MEENISGYELSRNYFDWSFENPELVYPNMSALYFFIIEHCNRLGWKKKFGLPTEMAKDAIGIKSYKTYINTFRDLEKFGFIEVIEASKNQYSSNIIALVKNTKAHTKALTKAVLKHIPKQVQSTYQSNDSIDKPITYNQEPITYNQNGGNFKNYLVVEMANAYKSKNPSISIEPSVHYPACLNICYRIAKIKGWSKNENLLTEKQSDVLSIWHLIIDFIKSDTWLSTRSLIDLNSDKEWDRLVLKMSLTKKTITTNKPSKLSEAVKAIENGD